MQFLEHLSNDEKHISYSYPSPCNECERNTLMAPLFNFWRVVSMNNCLYHFVSWKSLTRREAAKRSRAWHDFFPPAGGEKDKMLSHWSIAKNGKAMLLSNFSLPTFDTMMLNMMKKIGEIAEAIMFSWALCRRLMRNLPILPSTNIHQSCNLILKYASEAD